MGLLRLVLAVAGASIIVAVAFALLGVTAEIIRIGSGVVLGGLLTIRHSQREAG